MKEEKNNPRVPKEGKKSDLNKKITLFLKSLDIVSFIFPIIVVTILTANIFPKFFDILSHRSSPQKTTHEKLFEYLANGMTTGQIDEDFIKTAFNHFDRKGEGVLAKYGFIETLEDFVIFLNSSIQKDKEGVAKIDSNQIVILLNKARETEPFASLPSEERRLMDQIQVLLKNKSSEEDLLYVMNELKQVLLARHKEYQRIEVQNAWAIPLAWVGVVLTIIFGVWSIVLNIRKKRLELQELYYDPMVRKKEN